MDLLFRPSFALFCEFAQGRKEPYPALLICGPSSGGLCLGFYNLLVDVHTKRVDPLPTLARETHVAKEDFDCLSFYSVTNPLIQVASADIQPVRKGELFVLTELTSEKPAGYEEDLRKVISA